MPKEVVLIAAVTVDGFIARHSLEITSWSKDLQVFKKQTMGFPVIMGSNTDKTISNFLTGRRKIVVGRKDKPKNILTAIKEKRCFVIGGGKTFYRFSSFLTHLYITPHPHVFGSGVALFDSPKMKELNIKFLDLIEVDRGKGIFQYQYEVLRP